MTIRTYRLSLLALFVTLTFVAVEARAEAAKIKFVLNWKYQGPQGWFFLAEDLGFFKAENLDVAIDQGNGSGAAVPLVANGTYDAGFGDINALIEFAAKKPDEAPVAVYVMYNVPPFTIAVRADSAIKTPQDLAGKTLGGAPNDGALKLFPAFCKVTKIDCASVKNVALQPNLREQMLMQGQVDGVFGYVNTIRFSARAVGIDDSKLRYINFGDYGMDLYSNSIIVSKKLIKEKPEAVKGLVRAINKGLIEALKDPKGAVDSVLKREPLLKRDVEEARFDATLRGEMSHPEAARIGLGNVDSARLQRSIALLTDASALPRMPSESEIFTSGFLPPESEQIKKVF